MSPELPLRDIHLPAEPSWWPPAPGWWLLAVVVLAAACFSVIRLRGRQRHRRFRRAVLAEVDRIWERHVADDSGAAIVGEWSALLRRACLRYRPALASCSGEAWPAALGIGADSDHSLRLLLVEAPYRPTQSREEVMVLREPVRAALRRLVDGDADDGDGHG